MWPADEIECNARLPDGGHHQRLAHEQQLERQQQQQAASGDGGESGGGGGGAAAMRLSPEPLSAEQRAAVAAAELTEPGRRALAAHGWVCAGCLSPMPYRSRSVCDACHTLRHDAADAVGRWRCDGGNWLCGPCQEFNFPRDVVCRCCATARTEANEVRVVRHERVADEVRAAPIGTVLNVRNRVCRWQCNACEEINSLQCSACRNCRAERFTVTVACPACQSPQALSNKRVYGGERSDAKHSDSTFGIHNFYPRLAPTLACGHCRGPLHGGALTTLPHRPSWLCACGNVNTAIQVSCLRCRLPRSVPSAATLRALLWPAACLSQPSSSVVDVDAASGAVLPPSPIIKDSSSNSSGVAAEAAASQYSRDIGSSAALDALSVAARGWDLKGCSYWFCEGCDSANLASRYVVGSGGGSGRERGAISAADGDAGGSGTRHPRPRQHAKAARMVRGDSHCRSCNLPWHHYTQEPQNRQQQQQLNQRHQGFGGGGGSNAGAQGWWRCACHMVNQGRDSHCTACGLPAADWVSVDVLSQWTRGDWMCAACHRHNYRDRLQCGCGQPRPSK